jgi:ABC-type transporter MlaC component
MSNRIPCSEACPARSQKTRRYHLIAALCAGGMGLFGLPQPTWAAPDAAERTDAFIAAFKSVKSGEKLSPADRRANEQAFVALDRFMDFDTLIQKTIEPRAGKFTPKQKTEFASKFRDLIRRIAYPNSGEFFRSAKMKIGTAVEKGETTVVSIDAHVPKDDLKTKLQLSWSRAKAKDGTLKLVDVAFDGDSLIQDYQNQFARIIDKEGVAGLLRKVDEKKAELDRDARGKEARAAK